MNDPLTWALKRGTKLGIIWAAVFFGVTAALYGLMGVLGWSGTARLLCALLAGPVFAIMGIVGWWVIRRPRLVPPETESPTVLHDPRRTRISSPTRPFRRPEAPSEDKDDRPTAG